MLNSLFPVEPVSLQTYFFKDLFPSLFYKKYGHAAWFREKVLKELSIALSFIMTGLTCRRQPKPLIIGPFIQRERTSAIIFSLFIINNRSLYTKGKDECNNILSLYIITATSRKLCLFLNFLHYFISNAIISTFFYTAPLTDMNPVRNLLI